MQQSQIITVAGAAFTTTVGALAGYYYAKKKLTAEFEAISEKEIAEAKAFYAVIRKDDMPTPEAAVEKLIPENERPDVIKPGTRLAPKSEAAAKAMIDYTQGYKPEAKVKVEVEETTTVKVEEVPETVMEKNPEVNSIWVDGQPLNPDEWDPEVERDNRRNGVPYVVSQIEYDTNEDDNEQVILTWYEEDQTLVDEDENPIDDVEAVVGLDNLKRFGHGSGDSKVVYIRNEMRGMDYEVLHSSASYAEKVLGIGPDSDHLEHSAMASRRHRRSSEE